MRKAERKTARDIFFNIILILPNVINMKPEKLMILHKSLLELYVWRFNRIANEHRDR